MSEYFVVRKGAVALPNSTVLDAGLDFPALALLTWAQAQRPGRPLGYRAFLGHGLGEKMVRSALRTLEQAGYRHRFVLRGPDGRLRTLTVFFDVPQTREQALTELTDEQRSRLVTTRQTPTDPDTNLDPTDPEQHAPTPDTTPTQPHETSDPVDNRAETTHDHRADPGTARCHPQDYPQGDEVIHSSEDVEATVPRSTVARSTVPRSTTALSLRDTRTKVLRTNSSLRSETENHTQPDPDPHQTPAPRSGQVRSGQHARTSQPDPEPARPGQAGQAPPAAQPAPASAAPAARQASAQPATGTDQDAACGRTTQDTRHGASLPAGLTDREIELITTCLPDWMHALDRTGAHHVATLLDQRVQAGWTPTQIRAAVDGNPPANVTRMGGIAAHRIEFNLPLELAPNRTARTTSPAPTAPASQARATLAARRAAQDAADAARRQRSEALAGTHRTSRDYTGPAWDAALAQARATHPGAGRLEILAAAQHIYDNHNQPPAGKHQHVPHPDTCEAAA